MIERLKGEDKYMATTVADKLNELIDAHNEFRAQLEPLEAIIKDDGTVVWKERSEL